MFNKEAFSKILSKIISKYDSITEFADISTVGRSYISKYIHMKIDVPPSPKVLEKIAKASEGVTRYGELMKVCGYVDVIDFFFEESVHQIKNTLPVLYDIKRDGSIFMADCEYGKDIICSENLDENFEYFAYRTKEDSMAPLLNIDDIAIIEKQINGTFENRKTYLLEFEDKIMIRKIVETDKDNIELFAMNPYYPVIKTAKDKITIIGRVIKAENQSAFK